MDEEYKLNQWNGSVWTSVEGIYLTFDPVAGRLYFPDGSFWVCAALSAGSEQDAGTYYPTMIEDTNGNQILITYKPGQNVSYANSSARIATIEDVRGNGASDYTFTYNNTGTLPMADAKKKLTRKQEEAIVALLSNRNIEEAARACDTPPRTLHRWLREPAFDAVGVNSWNGEWRLQGHVWVTRNRIAISCARTWQVCLWPKCSCVGANEMQLSNRAEDERARKPNWRMRTRPEGSM